MTDLNAQLGECLVTARNTYDMRKVGRDIVSVSLNLFRVMIPALIIVKIATELGFDVFLISLFQPLMALMDLPPAAAIVLVTTMLTNPYTGLLVAASLPELTDLNTAQTSIIALFMLFTHGLPVEAMVSSKVGLRLWFVVMIRLLTAFISGIILATIFAQTGWLASPAHLSLPQITATDPSLIDWLTSQVIALFLIQLVIIILIAALELLRIIGVERLMTWLLSPILQLMGIGARASTIAIVGVCLGLTFGGGILMKDVATGTIPKRDVFGVLCFINLKHSAFEDTAVVMLLGPSLFVIVVVRLLFAVVMTTLAMLIARRLPDALWGKYLTNKNIPASAG